MTTPRAAGPTVGQLLVRRARETPGSTFLESARDDRVVTWSAAQESVDRWVRRLDGAGIPAGGRVSLRVADPLRFALAFLGILGAGRVVAPTAPEPSPAELARHLRTVSPAAVVQPTSADPGPADPGPADPGPAGSSPAYPGLAGPSPAEPDLVGDLGGGWASVEVADPPPGDRGAPGGGAGLVLASSGTTGPPKLVQLSETQLLHTATSIARHHGFTAADRGFNPLTLHHINAEVVGVLTALVAGSQLVLDDRFHRTGFWKLLADREVTWLNGVPAILAILAQQPVEPPAPPSLRFARSASAPLPVATLEAFERATGIGVVETYGMTEAGSQITANPVDGGRRPGSVGLPVGVELRVVDPAGTELASGAVGRVRIRGAGVITRYATETGNERLSADGWLDTGDLGHLDPDGFLHLAGRDDDIINRGGEKFFPGDIEDILLTDPGVAAAVVVGWPDPVLGSVPVAAIVLAPPAAADAEDPTASIVSRLTALAAERLDRPRRPVRFHVVDGLPSGVNGKISRRAVREQLHRSTGADPVSREPGP